MRIKRKLLLPNQKGRHSNMDIQILASSSKGNCYRVSDGSTSLLIEAGISIKLIRQELGFQLSGIAGMLITHEHGDHSKSVKDMIKAGIDCYMSQGTAEALNLHGHRIKVVKPHEPFKLGTWRILPFDTQHDAVDPLGFLLASKTGEKLLFITDSYYCKYKFQGMTHLMIECNYDLDILKDNVEAGLVDLVQKNRILQSHFSLANVKDFLSANDLSQVQEIHLIHLSEHNSDVERFKREVQELTGKPVYVAKA